MFYGNDASVTNLPPPQATGDIDESVYINAANNDMINIDPGLTQAALNRSNPNFKLAAAAAALTNGATPPNDGFFDTTATFVGGMGTDDWTVGWTSYPQN